MSEKRLLNAIRRLAILQMLNTREFITSKKIRDRFSPNFTITFYRIIEAFQESGWIETLEKDGEFAGDDRREYKLSLKGEKVRKNLLQELKSLLGSEIPSLESKARKDKDEQIKTLLSELSKELKGLINEESLTTLQKIVKDLLSKAL